MPSLDVALEHCKGKAFYALLDFLKGFWQLPLDKASQEILSYMTDKGIFTPTRVPQGSTDAALPFQSTVEMVLGDLVNRNVIVWIDDLLIFADTQEELVDAIDAVLTKLDEFGFVVNPKKSSLFLSEVRWCGRIINKHGIGHDPERIRALREMAIPTTAAELQQFLCASNWMRNGLVDYARVARPLQERLDVALTGTRKTKRAAAGIRIEFTDKELEAFETVKELLGNSAMLSFPNPAKQLCLLSDASDAGWGLVVTQVENWQPDIPIHEQHHELLVCMGGRFTGSALNWSVIEKGSYPIVHACEKLEYLLLRPQGFRLYCDHRNIIYLFSPSKELKRHVRGKLLRWSTKLLEYRYTIEHIEGVHNVWADLISRWGGQAVPAARIHAAKRFKRTKRKHLETETNKRVVTMTPLRPLDAESFVWPTINEIGEMQALHTAPKRAAVDSDELWRVEGKVWIPRDANLTQRILIIAHCGRHGHRGIHVMEDHIRRLFHIDGLSKIVSDFRSNEIHHTFERNATLHWDFLTLGDSFGSSRYVLVLKDEATHYVDLVACDSPTSEVAATAILDWYSRFGAPNVWVSDCGSHFKSKVISELSRRLKGRPEFILAYSSWKNGSVERVNRDILQVLKALVLEFRSSINHSPVLSLSNRAPIEIFTGPPCPTALDTVFFPEGKGRVISLAQPKPNTEQHLAKLRTNILEMHKAVKVERTRQAKMYRARHHYHQAVTFSVGDYVLRSRVDEKLHANKLRVMWVGPYRVVGSADYYFTVKHLVNGSTIDVHPSRLKLYADESLNVNEELLDHVAVQGTLLAVETIVEHRMNTDMLAYAVKVKWLGLEAIEDSWEPMKTMSEDVPQLLLKYAKSSNR
ncbi:hypothetical protein PHMEG_00031098 [Phytophthora megakarya]|uniref:Reverse transcriptase n=1 Tax=Phytophthora megakarya TaxID=4795 RepID=A0A225UZ40_9STRA|nr:hypothetical protein PHMEG_00031098 [Phytophthora megakarya]